MMKRIPLLVVGLALYAFSSHAQNPPTPAAGAMVLTQETVRELTLKQSPRALEISLRYQQFRLDPILALAAYDWRVLAQTGLEWDRSASLLTSPSTTVAEYERSRTNISLQKPFTTGTLLGIELSRLSQNVSYDGTPITAAPSDQTLDSAGLILEQSLLGNSFGRADRGTVNAAKLNYEANTIARADELEGVVLQTLQQFWNSFIAQEAHKAAVNSRDRYKRLVEAVRRKTSLGYSNPGDLPQVQAEFEAREQRVAVAAYENLKTQEDLRTLLGIAPGTPLSLQVPLDIPNIPGLPEKKIEELRAIRAQRLRAEAAEESLIAAESLRWPTLNLVGRAYTTGVGDNPQASFSDVTSVNRPSYYAGIKFQYNFGSGAQRETVLNRQLNRDLQSTILNRQSLESADTEAQARRRAEAQHAIAVSSKRQRDFREKAQQELNRSYNQGRTDIAILITAMNNFFDAEIQYVRSLGDYAMSVNQWAAFRDELVPDEASP